MQEIKTFEDFGFSKDIKDAIAQKGYTNPSPIQAKAIPVLLGKPGNLVGKAQTGTGKTAAFGLPILEQLEIGAKKVQAVILTPTRELAMQVAEELVSLKGAKRLRIQTVYGGQSIGKQLSALERGVDIVIGTPGRIKDHLYRKSLDMSGLKFFVLDEADEMLNMGFIEEIEEILEHTNPDKRMLLFSATMPKKILKLISNYMPKYDLVEVEAQQMTTDLTEQIYYSVKNNERFDVLCRIIDSSREFYGIVFSNTKRDVDDITQRLIERGIDAEALHGDIQQAQRETILKKFKKRKIHVLVATDVAARGIDVNDLTHVVNYELPQDPESYVHRIGRTGRAGKKGIAITLASARENGDLLFIQKIANAKITRKSLPTVTEALEVKKQIIKDKIQNIIEHSGYLDYVEVAQEILADNDPEIALASILKQAFQDQLSMEKYVEFQPDRNESFSREREGGRDGGRMGGRSGGRDEQAPAGMTRIFIAKGKFDGMNPRAMVDFIINETNLSSRNIDDIRVFDSFTFATIPSEAAESLVALHKKLAKGGKPLITLARGKEGDDERPAKRKFNNDPERSFKKNLKSGFRRY